MRQQPSLHLPASDARNTSERSLCRTTPLTHRVLDYSIWLLRIACGGIQRQGRLCGPGEVEHVVQHTGAGVERIVTDATGTPVVLDEPQNRGLIRLRVVDEVRLEYGEMTSSGSRGP